MPHEALCLTPPCQDPGFGEDPVEGLLPLALPGHLEFPCEEEAPSRLEVLPVLNFNWPGLLRQKNSCTERSRSTYGGCRGSEILSHSSAEVEVYVGGMSEA